MGQQKWVWTAVTCLCAVGCGGQAQEDVQSSDSGTPPSGFYSILYESVSDSCQPIVSGHEKWLFDSVPIEAARPASRRRRTSRTKPSNASGASTHLETPLSWSIGRRPIPM